MGNAQSIGEFAESDPAAKTCVDTFEKAKGLFGMNHARPMQVCLHDVPQVAGKAVRYRACF